MSVYGYVALSVFIGIQSSRVDVDRQGFVDLLADRLKFYA